MERKLPLVSILIPCYNASEFLDGAVRSVIDQTYRNIEIIFIDDGSTDDTIQILNRYRQEDERIRIYQNEANRGLIWTLNFGITKCTGEFIARMDADDLCEDNRIELQVNQFRNDPSLDVLGTFGRYIDVKDRDKGRLPSKGTLHGSLKFISFFSTPVVHPSVMLRKEVFDDNKYDSEFIHSEDYELFTRLIFLGYKFRNLPGYIYKLRINPGSVSRKFESIQKATHTRISERNIEDYFGSVPEYFVHKVLINRIVFKVTPRMIKEAFELIIKYRDTFMKKEDLSLHEKEEIEYFIHEQKIDILFQSVKYTPFPDFIPILFMVLGNFRLFTKRRGMRYMLIKLRSKY